MAVDDRFRLQILCLFCYLLTLVSGEGEFTIVYSPKYVHFLSDASAIETSDVAPVISSSLGLPINNELKWNGLAEGSLFQRPKASVIISVLSIPHGHLKLPHQLASFQTIETSSELDTDTIVDSIQSLGLDDGPLIVDFSMDSTVFDVKSRHPSLFSGLPTTLTGLCEDLVSDPRWFSARQLGSLNVSRDTDLILLAELYIVKEIVNAMSEHKESIKANAPDFYHFKVTGLRELSQVYGANSVQMKDALQILGQVIDEVATGFKKLYNQNVVIQVLGFSPESQDVGGVRIGRSLLQDSAMVSANITDRLNLAPKSNYMYPAIFNICLWIMIGMALAVFAISWGIWNMDPGRDSLIYRMTTQRMKKD